MSPPRWVRQSASARNPPVVDSAPFGLPAGTKNDQENATLDLVRAVALDDRSSALTHMESPLSGRRGIP